MMDTSSDGKVVPQVIYESLCVKAKDTTSSHVQLPVENFWRSTEVWILKPQVVNKWTAGSIIRSRSHYKFVGERQQDIRESLGTNLQKELSQIALQFCRSDDDNVGLVDGLMNHVCGETWQVSGEEDCSLCLIVRQVLPKNLQYACKVTELIFLDYESSSAVFIPVLNHVSSCQEVCPSHDPMYSVTFEAAAKRLKLQAWDPALDVPVVKQNVKVKWLPNLLASLAKWCHVHDLNTQPTTLRLVNVEEYSNLYQELKGKYAQSFIENWSESTDPEKFVHEDLGIAAYILLVWRAEGGSSKQTFVDLGCGNGLLVHVLTREGYEGVGLDIQSRKIWESYGPSTKLREHTINPSTGETYPDNTWLLGNHCDELSPWLPVMAARSSQDHKFFLLPCCPWDFSAKFRYKGSGQYGQYLDFLGSVGEACGFEMERDELRIPSTRKHCFVGRHKTHRVEDRDEILHQMDSFIASRGGGDASAGTASSAEAGGDGAAAFVPREANPGAAVRNCTRLPGEVKDSVVRRVVTAVLGAAPAKTYSTGDGRPWRCGGKLALGEAAGLLSRDTLGQLKQQCGGLQTLLRNHRHVFRVQGGYIYLRLPEDEYSSRKRKPKSGTKRPYKVVPCWFHFHHPDGCPKTEPECSFQHTVSGES